jgi:hypothetical protein
MTFQVRFFCKDKDLGEVFKRLAGIAYDVEHAYVPNVGEHTSKANGKMSAKVVNATELFSKELHKRGTTNITGPEFKELVTKLGLATSSYSYFLQNLVRAGVLKKGKKEKNAMNYSLTGK